MPLTLLFFVFCCVCQQGIFGTWHMNGIGWVPQIGTLLWLLPYSEYTKRMVRENPDSWWARHMAW
jgi:hypothetical protein